jgi:hypothetical protein
MKAYLKYKVLDLKINTTSFIAIDAQCSSFELNTFVVELK